MGSAIDALKARADHTKPKALLEELADLISPGTAERAACHSLFYLKPRVSGDDKTKGTPPGVSQGGAGKRINTPPRA